jgi:HAD superfamily hydrolase (TIGR01509 family)
MTLPKAVLFDCDGVLVDTEPPTFALLQAELATRGLVMDLDEMERVFIGGTMEKLADMARDMGADLPDDWVPYFYEKLHKHLETNAPLITGIEAVLDALDAAGIPYAIGSNGRAGKMAITLGQHPAFLARFKGHVYSGQDLGCPKPDAGLYLHAAAALGVRPADCVVVEDSPTGAMAAKNAQMRCMGYAPHGPNPVLEATGARLFTSMAALPALLGLPA